MNMCVSVSVCRVCVCGGATNRGQKRVLDPQELEVVDTSLLMWCWGLNLGPLEERCVLLTNKPSLWPPTSSVLMISQQLLRFYRLRFLPWVSNMSNCFVVACTWAIQTHFTANSTVFLWDPRLLDSFARQSIVFLTPPSIDLHSDFFLLTPYHTQLRKVVTIIIVSLKSSETSSIRMSWELCLWFCPCPHLSTSVFFLLVSKIPCLQHRSLVKIFGSLSVTSKYYTNVLTASRRPLETSLFPSPAVTIIVSPFHLTFTLYQVSY